jgi:hypothetical protein
MMQIDIRANTALQDLLRADREHARARQKRLEQAAEHHAGDLCRELRRQRNEARKLARFMAMGWVVLLLLWLGVTWFNAHGWPEWLS